MKTGIRLKEYIKMLLERRKNEGIKANSLNKQGESFTSPVGSTSTEEIRMFNEYKEQANLFSVTNATPEKKKPIILKRFFKMKRNQQVEVYSQVGEEVVHTIAKVSAVGRDFVMLTNLKDRIWLPYHAITSANVPSGFPSYSNSHQYFIYDNGLRRKLLTNFGETVSRRDVLIQQFYEETLLTNLRSWRGTWVKIKTAEKVYSGKIFDVKNKKLKLSSIRDEKEIEIESIVCVQSLRFLAFLSLFARA